MKSLMKISLILLFIIAGCTNQNEDTLSSADWEVSPTFQAYGVEMRGIPDRLALGETPFIAGEEKQYTWFFWGHLDDLSEKITVMAEKQHSGSSTTLLEKVYMLPVTPKHGADHHLPCLMTLPSPGIWKLNVYIGVTYYDSVIVEAE